MAITKTIGNLVDELITTDIRIWMAEDIKRKTNAADYEIANATRITNVANVQRNKLIQAIDEALGQESFQQGDSKLYGKAVSESVEKVYAGLKQVSETPAMDNPFIQRIAVGEIHKELAVFIKELVDETRNNKILHLSPVSKFEPDLKTTYDLILVYAFVEQCNYAFNYFDNIFELQFKKMIVSVPFFKAPNKYENGIFHDPSHPDQIAWYSPYTLFNLFKENITRTNAKWKLSFVENYTYIILEISYE